MFKITPQKRVLLPRTLAMVMVGVLSVTSIFLGVITATTQEAIAANATNNTLNFQARLENANGSIVPDGNYNVQFKLYDGGTVGGPAGKGAANAGTNLWTETWQNSNSQGVRVVNGYLSVSLGSVNPFPSTINWDQGLWLTMNIGGTTTGASPTYDGEMNPRLKLTGVPYALRAGQLAAYNSSADLTSTLSIVQPTVGSQTFQIADQGAAGSYTICVQSAAANTGGCAPTTGGTGYIQNQNTTQQGTSNFWISGSGRADTSFLTPAIDVASAGTLSIGVTTATTVNIATNNAAHTIAVGTGTSAQSITIGSTSGASALTLRAGTGNLSVTGAAGTTYTIGATNTTGTTTIGQSTATNIINIGNAANTNTQTINIGTGSTGTGKDNVTIGSINGGSTTTIQAGSGNLNLSAATTGVSGALNVTGAINGSSTVTGTTVNGTTGINTGSGSGTQRIDSSGNITAANISGNGEAHFSNPIIGTYADPNSGVDNAIKVGSGGISVNGDSVFNNNFSLGGSLHQTGTGVTNYMMSALGLGTTNPQAGGALTIANGKWISAVDALGTGYVNMFQVNSSNQIQVGAALNVDGGIVLPTDGGPLTLIDEAFSAGITAGTANSYTLGIGQANALTVYGENDGSGNAQNVRVGIGSSITPGYTLDVGGDANITGDYRVSGTSVISASRVLQNVTADAGILTTGTLGVARGGTGAASFTANGVLYGNGTSALGVTAVGSTGDCLVGNTGAAPSWAACSSVGSGGTPGGAAGGDLSGSYPNPSVSKIAGTALNISGPVSGQILVWNGTGWTNTAMSGDVKISGTGVATIQANSVALGTDTTGNYVSGLTAGSGISITGTAGEGWSPTVAVSSDVCTISSGNCTGANGGSGNGNYIENNATATAQVGASFNIDGTGTANTLKANSFNLGANTIVTSLGVLQNVTADAGILTSGTIATSLLTGPYTGITGVGTITTGTWNGTAIADTYVADNLTVSTAGNVAWTALSSYPTGCTAGKAVTTIGDTLTCSTFATTDTNTTYSAGNDLNLVGTTFNLDTQLDTVTTISRASSNLTLQTTTSGNIVLNSAGTIELQDSTNVTGNLGVTGNITSSAGVLSVQGTGSNFFAGAVGIGTQTPQGMLDVRGGFMATGFTTTNPAGTFVNQWTRLGECTIATQFHRCEAVLQLSATNSGAAGTFAVANVDWRVKQQTALGTAPFVELYMSDNNYVTKDDVVAVVTQNDATATVVDLYLRPTTSSLQYHFNPAFASGTNSTELNWFELDGYTATLPAGTQTAASYLNGNFVDGAFSGNLSVGGQQVITSGQVLQNVTADASILTSGTISTSLLTGSYTGITGVGTITTGTWNGTAIADTYVADNLTVSTAGNVAWTALSSYPTACGAGTAVTAVGDTLTCGTFATTDTNTTYSPGNDLDISGTTFNIEPQLDFVTTINRTSSNLTLQTTTSGNIVLNSAGTIELQDNTNVTGGLSATGNISTSAGDLQIGATSVITSTKVLQNVTTDASIINNGTGTLNVNRGGTGAASFTANGILYGSGTGALGVTAAGTTGDCLVGNTGAAPSWTACSSVGGGGTPGGAAGGDLGGTYPNPTIAKLQGSTLTITTSASGNFLQYNGTAWVNQSVSGDITISSTGVASIGTSKVTSAMIVDGTVTGTDITNNTITNSDIASGAFSNITGTGALASGSIASGFGTISTGNTITGTTLNGTTGVNTGAGSGTQRIDSSGNLTNIGSVTAAGNITTSGDLTTGNQRTISFTRTLPTVVDNEVDLGSFSVTNGAGSLYIHVTVPSTGFSMAKQYAVPIYWNATAGTWQIAQPITDSGNYGGNDIALEINVLNGTASLRLHRTAGTTAGTAYVTITQQGVGSDAFTASSATSAITAPTVYYGPAIASQSGGTFSIQGNLTVANGGGFTIGGQQVITSGRVLQGVTADASILTSGTISTSLLTGSYTGITGVGTLTVGTWNAGVIGDAYINDTLTVGTAGNVAWLALSGYPTACGAGTAITALNDVPTCSTFATTDTNTTYSPGNDLDIVGTTFNIEPQLDFVSTISRASSNLTLQTTTSGNIVLNSAGTIELQDNTNVTGTLAATTKITAPLIDTASAGVLSIGTTNATGIALNKNVTVASGQYIALVGGATNTRPASPTEGMLYYDTTTKSLIVYSNGKWQADRSSSTVLVGTSASGDVSGAVASKAPDGADFVNTSTTSAQTTINSAITSLGSTGGTVYLMEGTYIVDGSISLPSNVTLEGAGPATILKFKNAINATAQMIVNSDTVGGNTRQAIRNMKLDGNSANNASGTMDGIYMRVVGSGSGATGVPGFTIDGLTIENFNDNGMDVATINNSTISNTTVKGSGSSGITISHGTSVAVTNIRSNGNGTHGLNLQALASDGNTTGVSITASEFSGNASEGLLVSTATGMFNTNDTISGNVFSGNGIEGLELLGTNGTVRGVSVIGNTSTGNVSSGFKLLGATNNTISGNTSTGNSTNGIFIINGANSNIVSGNKLYDNGGTGNSDGVNITTSDNNTITGNDITDTAGTGSAIDIVSGTGNYLADNHYSGTGATTISDAGTGTIYANQLNGSNQLVNRASGGMSVQNSSGLNVFSGDYANSQLVVGQASGLNGKLAFANATNANLVTIVSGTTTGTGYQLTLPTALSGVSGDCLKDTTGTGVLGFGSCGTGGGGSTLQAAYTASTNPEITLDTTRNGLTIRNASADAITGNLLEIQNNAGTATFLGVTPTAVNLQDSSGNAALGFDSTNSILKIYENVASPTNYASISYSGGKAIFSASSGTTQIGSGTGSVTSNLTGSTDVFSFAKTYTPGAAYSLNDFTLQRALTAGTFSATGSVVKIEDASTGSAVAPNVLLINQGNTSATGNLILAQTGGTTTKFSVSTAGLVNAVGGYAANGTSGANVTCSSGNVLTNQVVQGGITTGGTCAAGGGGSGGTLQNAYDNSTAPASILMTNAKDFVVTSPDTATDSNVLINLQCTTCSASGGRFAVQDAGVDILLVNPDGSIRIGDATNNMTFSASTKEPSLNGTARHTRKITIVPEYAGASMTGDGTNNNGTMTSDNETSSPFRNYYKWTTTQGTAQDYDIWVKVPVPSDFSAMPSGQTICLDTYASASTANLVTMSVYGTNNASVISAGDVSPLAAASWQNKCTASITGGTFAADGVMTLDIKLTAPATTGEVRIGNITLNYLSKW